MDQNWGLPLALGLVSLIGLQLVVVKGTAMGMRVVALFCAGLLAGVVAIHLWLGPPRFLPVASTSQLARGLADRIAAGVGDGRAPARFLLLDGGSYAARGVDERALQRRLSRSLDEDIVVLGLTVPGGNQLERLAVLKLAVDLLDPDVRAAFEAAPKTLLLEVHANYDRYPLVQLRRNRYSDRAYAYLDGEIAIAAIRSDFQEASLGDRVERWQDVTVHAAVNMFNVGKATRMARASDVLPIRGYQALQEPVAGFSYRGMRKLRRQLANPPRAHVELPRANIERRRERIERLVGEGAGVVYFSVPNPTLAHLEYTKAFCAEFRDVPCISHADERLLRQLDRKRFWYDGGHLLEPGAVVYTRWLARKVAQAMAREDAGA